MQAAQRNRTFSLKKVAYTLLTLLLVLALGVAAGLLWYRAASQPQRDGVLALPATSGLRADVDVVRDAEGIPHIYAATPEDALFALGYVHAQDRLWQLEMHRRIASGRLAEILGPSALPADKVLRTLGVRRNAERIVARMAPATRAALDAYTRGINTYLAQRHGPLPPEFLLTGAPAPEPWQAADSVGWQTMMAWDLGGNWSQEVLRMRLAQHFSLAQINQLLAPYPGEAPLATRDYTALYRHLAAAAEQLVQVQAAAPPSMVEGKGSNNWVVAGGRSRSGKPLLANDPHLGLGVPSLWYFAHLSAPGLQVVGATLPGLPMVVLGRTERIAWGFTNTGPDVQDLFIEQVNPDNPRQYRTPSGWAEFEEWTENIRVKGQPDVPLTVRATRHGPVLSGAFSAVDQAPAGANRVIAFSWTALRADDRTLQAGLQLNRAHDWPSFLDALRDFGAPQQNMVYADVEGNIGFVAPGRIPIRKPENDLQGLAPAPGWEARYDWDGFVPFEELPRAFNPPTQQIVTANQKIVAENYPYFLTSEWAAPYRAERIQQLLAARARHDLDSFAALQADTVSLAARELLPLMMRNLPAANKMSADAGRALELLRAWDGNMLAQRPEPLIFHAWLRAAARSMFAHRMSEALFRDYWDMRNVLPPMKNALAGQAGWEAWCQTPAPTAGSSKGDCAALLTVALETALTELRHRHGKDMQAWRWGEAHPALAEHRPFGKVPALARWFDLEVPSPGDTFTVNVGRYSVRDEEQPFANRHAATLRALYDLSDLEQSRFMLSTGQSGNVLSPLYSNFLQRWVEVKYLRIRTARAAVEQGSLGTLRLQPQTRGRGE